MKDELSKPTTLALYDPDPPTKVSADASSYSLGAVLLQQSNDRWKPVSFASRSMSKTEGRYAQIEKEALATTWACEKFANFILGKHIQVEIDHKPLMPLLGLKHLDSLPPRILRFRLQLDRFSYDIKHIPGKEMYTADTLSRAPISQPRATDSTTLEELAELCVMGAISHLPSKSQRVQTYRQEQTKDPVCKILFEYCQHGWPDRKDADPVTRPYWEAQGELTVGDGLLMLGSWMVVPKALQLETLRKIHEGHQGIVRCTLLAKTAVWWPGISRDITDFIKKFPECARDTIPNKEPLISTSLPKYPWQKVAADLFALQGSNYLVIVDYFSRYPEVIQLRSTTSMSIVNAPKSTFARHGIAEVLMTDNGPQFSSVEFGEFAKRYNFTHITSSPHYPASNGQAERAVQTIKHPLRKADDPFLAILSYRATPLPWCAKSPAELLMGRKLRTTLPRTSESLVPQWPHLQEFRERNKHFKEKQKADYDRRHRVHDLPPIPDETDRYVTTNGNCTEGRTVTRADTPLWYIVRTPTGDIRCNRSHLNIDPSNTRPQTTATQDCSPIMTRSPTGTSIAPPDRL